MIDDLTMLANLAIVEATATSTKAERDKAAAAETMPPPKHKRRSGRDTKAARLVRRGQDPPEPEPRRTKSR